MEGIELAVMSLYIVQGPNRDTMAPTPQSALEDEDS